MSKYDLKKEWKADDRECFIIDDAWLGGRKEVLKEIVDFLNEQLKAKRELIKIKELKFLLK